MLEPRARDAYALQNYAGRPAIDGVTFTDLRRFHDDGGSMTELARLDGGAVQGLPGFQARQVNFSEVEPGAIKAFHLHLRQTDVWYVPPASKMLVILGDARDGSPTSGSVQRFVLGDGTSKLLRIPPGVAHGVRNLAACRGQIIYFVDVNFDAHPDRCDEGRLPWDHFGADIWEVQRG